MTQIGVSYVEREQASEETHAFYDRAEDRFQALLNIFKVFGHHPEYGNAFTDLIMAILKDGELDWLTKELLILKATQGNDCQYCVIQHERLCDMLGMAEEKIRDIDGVKYRTSPHFTEGEVALLDFCIQIAEDANRVPKELWERLHAHWTEPQIVDAAFVITTYIMVSKFGDCLGVELEPMFDGVKPMLTIDHPQGGGVDTREGAGAFFSAPASASVQPEGDASMKIEIFSTPQCNYCDAAKKLLDDKGLAYINLDVMSDPAILEDFKNRLPRVKAVPQIFIDGEHIGGYEDLRLHFQDQ